MRESFRSMTAPRQKYEQALSLQESGDHEACARLCNEILADQPSAPVANLLGYCLHQMGKTDFAERVFLGALEIDPDSVLALCNLGNMYREQMRYRQAWLMLHRALAASPESHRVYHNMAVVAMDMGHYYDAYTYARRALEIEPENLTTRHVLSLACLNTGRWEEGWPLYDTRKQIFQRDDAPLPAYEGGKGRVIVRQEQGLGDTLMVARWLPKLRQMGADVSVVVPKALEKLIEQSGLADIYQPGDEDFTHHLWTMDLLGMFATDWASTSGKPYLEADEAQVAEFAAKLPKDKPLIGICWAGSSREDDKTAYIIDRRRSMSAQNAVELFEGLDCEVVNLTREWGLPSAIDFGCGIADFAEMAALMKNLDLVISVDTAVCHLAGGLGVPTWLMSKYEPCWRWWPYQEKTVLYDSMRCYYQHEFMNWRGVIGQVRGDLETFLAENRKH